MDRLDEYIAVSERLTGHRREELLGTGSAEELLLTLHRAVPEPVLDDILAVADEMTTNDRAVADGAAGTDDGAITRLLADPRLGPVARNIIVLWYCGTWQRLDDDWLREHDGPAVDDHVVSANAYLSGLQWTVVGAHAPGGNPQGFASWSRRPADPELEGAHR